MSPSEKDKRKFQRTPFAREPQWLPVAKRIRVRFGGRYIADSRRVMLMRGLPAVYYFPLQDVRMDYLESTDHKTTSKKLGEATHYHVKVDDQSARHAAWMYENPSEKAPEDLTGYVAFQWKSMDIWLEEDEPVRTHPRDPYTRLDVIQSSRHVKIIHAGHTLAESHRPVLLFETGLPVRYYLYQTDVRMDLLKPSDRQTDCPYKGKASYYSMAMEEKEKLNIAWYYPFPNTEVLKIKDLICFYTEQLDDLIVDGESQPSVPLPESE